MDSRNPAARADRTILIAFWLVMAFIFLAAAAPLAQRYEADILPVVGDFAIREVRTEGDAIVISGDMAKRRDCTFLSLSFYAGDPDDLERPRERLHVTFLDQPDGVDPSRLPGRQPWGPWRLERPRDADHPTVFMRATHHCHPLWNTSGVYLALPVAALFGGAAPDPAAGTPRGEVWQEEPR